MPVQSGETAPLERVVAAMAAQQRQVGGRLHADLADHIPSYRAVPPELLEQIWHRHFQRALAVVREGTVPAPEDFGEAEVARDRVARGVPLSDGLRAFRRALSAIRDLFIAEATERGLDPGLVVDRTKCLWELADVASLQVAAVHRQAEVASALFDDMDHWVREGKKMPSSPRFKRKGPAIARDPQTGNMVGGVRPPWIEVPSAAYLTDQETGCGTVYDTKVPYSRDRLRALYGNFDSYARKFEAAKKSAVTQGYLLPEDAAHLDPIAKPADF